MVIIGSDHTGIELKKKIINYLYDNHVEYADAVSYTHLDVYKRQSWKLVMSKGTVGSNPTSSAIFLFIYGEVPKWGRGQFAKLLGLNRGCLLYTS